MKSARFLAIAALGLLPVSSYAVNFVNEGDKAVELTVMGPQCSPDNILFTTNVDSKGKVVWEGTNDHRPERVCVSVALMGSEQSVSTGNISNLNCDVGAQFRTDWNWDLWLDHYLDPHCE